MNFGPILLALMVLYSENLVAAVTRQPKEVGVTGRLWCQVGTKKEYGPQQCDDGVEECFFFTCDGGQHDFVVRGCGISVTTIGTGLPNESCFQAQSVCQYLNGNSTCATCRNKHMCNDGFFNFKWLTICLVLILPVFLKL
ncbi:unnamed protein product, partial [Mesorhabditis spiculigera]